MKKIAAVVVTFNPSKENVNKLVSILSPQVSQVYLIDNGSDDINFLDSNNTSLVNLIVLHKNMGIAEAQNIGINQAIKDRASHLVFFDQDSMIDDNMIEKLSFSFCQLSQQDKIGAVGPVFYDPEYNFVYPQIRLNRYIGRRRIIPKDNDQPIDVSFIISSGTFTSTAVMIDVGNMKSELFIDYVDTEWCLRATSKGYKFYAIPEIKMIHTIGDNKIKFLIWNLPVHSPWRRYFRMRNMYYLFGLSYIPLSLKIREFIINNLHQLLIIMSRESKFSYLKYWFKSQVDGITMIITGKINK